MADVKKYIWVLPVIAGILAILSLLTPVASMNYMGMGMLTANLWMWDLYTYDFSAVMGPSGTGFVTEPMVMIPSLIVTSLIAIGGTVSLVCGLRLRRNGDIRKIIIPSALMGILFISSKVKIDSRPKMLARRVFIASMMLLLLTSATSRPLNPGHHTALPHSSAAPAEVIATQLARHVYNNVSVSTYTDFIFNLTEEGPRPYGSENNNIARDWIITVLGEVSDGKIEVDVVGSKQSIVGRLPGTLGSNGPCLIVGGHYDTVGSSLGANDDGTGVAGALELARVMSNYDWPLDIYFGFWNDEETGLWGSREVAPVFIADEIDILAYFNIDMLLVQDENAPMDERVLMIYSTAHGGLYQDSQYWAELTSALNNNFDAEGPTIHPIPDHSFQYWQYSDHYAFLEAGYKSVLFAFESGLDRDTWYHTENDVWNNTVYDYDLARDTVASIGATMAYAMSRTPGQSTHSRYVNSIAPGVTREYLFVTSIATDVEVIGNWHGDTQLDIELRNPFGVVLESDSISASSALNLTLLEASTSDHGIHTVSVTNTGPDIRDIYIDIIHDSDVEGNGIPDGEDVWHNRFDFDSDYDLISDAEEIILGSNRYDADGDDDGLSDYEEIFIYGTDPLNFDSDFDQMPDKWELDNGLDPLDPSDASLDPDGDGMSNLEEYQGGFNPMVPDAPLALWIIGIILGASLAAIAFIIIILRYRFRIGSKHKF